MTKIGVLELESFFPATERFALAMRSTTCWPRPASPPGSTARRSTWRRCSTPPTGKPRIAVVSIAHLGDAERMFFVALLLEQVLAWVRAQRGTTSLRAVLYMDELFGYLPPTANPPSKVPLLTLLKQARAYGLGCVLSTQNPVDLDYKALSNAGTWFLGRLQTERDKARVLDGLEGVAVGLGPGLRPRRHSTTLLSSLDKRVFLLHNVHDREPLLFQIALGDVVPARSDGPRRDPRADGSGAGRRCAAGRHAGHRAAASRPSRPQRRRQPQPLRAAPAAARPIVPPDVPQFFAPGDRPLVGADAGRRRPRELQRRQARTRRDQRHRGVDAAHRRPGRRGLGARRAGRLRRRRADAASRAAAARSRRCRRRPPSRRATPPGPRSSSSWAARSQSVELLRSARDRSSRRIPGETEGDFRVRVHHAAARAARRGDRERCARSRRRSSRRSTRRSARPAQAVQKEDQQASDQKCRRRRVGGRHGARRALRPQGRQRHQRRPRRPRRHAASAASAASRRTSARAKANVEALTAQREALAASLEADLQALQADWSADAEAFDRVVVKPKRGGVQPQLVALVWRPEPSSGVEPSPRRVSRAVTLVVS